jgi:hypothetical protein
MYLWKIKLIAILAFIKTIPINKEANEPTVGTSGAITGWGTLNSGMILRETINIFRTAITHSSPSPSLSLPMWWGKSLLVGWQLIGTCKIVRIT